MYYVNIYYGIRIRILKSRFFSEPFGKFPVIRVYSDFSGKSDIISAKSLKYIVFDYICFHTFFRTVYNRSGA